MYAKVAILEDQDCELPYGLDNFSRKKMICAGYRKVITINYQ